jgi:hypothetical protein
MTAAGDLRFAVLTVYEYPAQRVSLFRSLSSVSMTFGHEVFQP